MKTTQLILLLLVSTQTFAGGKNKMSDLNLTEDQKAQMKTVKQNMKERIEAARLEITEQAHAEMALFLTAEQMEQVINREEKRMNHQDKRQEKRENKRERRKMRKETKNAE